MGNRKVETRWITRLGLVFFGLVLACGCMRSSGRGQDPIDIDEEKAEAEASPRPPTPTEAMIYTADENPCITWNLLGGGGPPGQDLIDIEEGKAVLKRLAGGYYAAYSPDGQTIVTMKYSDIYLWRADSYDLMHTLAGESDKIPSFSPDSKRLATIHDNHTIRVWDVESRDPNEDFEISVDPDDTRSYGDSIGAIQFSPNGDLIAVGIGRSIAIVNVTSGEVVRVLAGELLSNPEDTMTVEVKNGPASEVSQLVFDNSGKFLFSNENAGWFHLWEVETGQYLRCIHHGLSPYSKMALSPDGRTIAVAMSNKIQFYDATNGDLLDIWRIPDDRYFQFDTEGSPPLRNSMVYSSDGRTIMVGLEDGTVRIYDALTDKLIGLLRHPGSVSSVEANGNSDRIITGIMGGEGLNEAWIWDANHEDVLLEIPVQNLLEDGVSKALGGDIEGAKVVFEQAQANNPFPAHDLYLEGMERVTVAFIDLAAESAVVGDSRRALELIDLALEVNPHPDLDLRNLAIHNLVWQICVQAGRDLTPEEYELYRPNDPSAEPCR